MANGVQMTHNADGSCPSGTPDETTRLNEQYTMMMMMMAPPSSPPASSGLPMGAIVGIIIGVVVVVVVLVFLAMKALAPKPKKPADTSFEIHSGSAV